MNTVNGMSALVIALGMLSLVGVRRAARPRLALRAAVGGFVGLNGLTVILCLAWLLWAPTPALAQAAETGAGLSGAALGAALATGLACIGAGIAVGIAGAAAIGGITEKPEILGRTLIFVGLAEGIAIYGLIISFMILNA